MTEPETSIAGETNLPPNSMFWEGEGDGGVAGSERAANESDIWWADVNMNWLANLTDFRQMDAENSNAYEGLRL